MCIIISHTHTVNVICVVHFHEQMQMIHKLIYIKEAWSCVVVDV